jgi:hypothetical protein
MNPVISTLTAWPEGEIQCPARYILSNREEVLRSVLRGVDRYCKLYSTKQLHFSIEGCKVTPDKGEALFTMILYKRVVRYEETKMAPTGLSASIIEKAHRETADTRAVTRKYATNC